MHPEDVKAGLRKNGTSLAVIAKNLGISRSVVSESLRTRTSRRVDQAIAKALKQPLHAVWPDRYPRRES